MSVTKLRGGRRTGPARFRAGLLLALLASWAPLQLASCASAPERRLLAAEWFTLGNARFEKKEWTEAAAAYGRALALDSSLAGARFNLARALAESGRPVEALGALESLLESEPGNSEFLSMQAYLFWRSGDAQAAREVYAELAALVPEDPKTRYNLAVLDEATGNFAAARDAFAALVALDPKDADSLGRLAACEEALGDAAAAIAALEAYLKLRSGDAAAEAKLEALKAPPPEPVAGETAPAPASEPAPDSAPDSAPVPAEPGS
ncbi:MAG: tetratricopeptide repeat protein [Spirochaetales bacterium]|nr:tetratricopeptide repeat protein [Spirochaetales bacterium]